MAKKKEHEFKFEVGDEVKISDTQIIYKKREKETDKLEEESRKEVSIGVGTVKQRIVGGSYVVVYQAKDKDFPMEGTFPEAKLEKA